MTHGREQATTTMDPYYLPAIFIFPTAAASLEGNGPPLSKTQVPCVRTVGASRARARPKSQSLNLNSIQFAHAGLHVALALPFGTVDANMAVLRCRYRYQHKVHAANALPSIVPCCCSS